MSVKPEIVAKTTSVYSTIIPGSDRNISINEDQLLVWSVQTERYPASMIKIATLTTR